MTDEAAAFKLIGLHDALYTALDGLVELTEELGADRMDRVMRLGQVPKQTAGLVAVATGAAILGQRGVEHDVWGPLDTLVETARQLVELPDDAEVRAEITTEMSGK